LNEAKQLEVSPQVPIPSESQPHQHPEQQDDDLDEQMFSNSAESWNRLDDSEDLLMQIEEIMLSIDSDDFQKDDEVRSNSSNIGTGERSLRE